MIRGNASGNFPDAFPNDPSEWSDSDGDGIGDNSDIIDSAEIVLILTRCPDSDGDGY